MHSEAVNQKKFAQLSPFEAVILVSQRAYDLKSGSLPEINCSDNDKVAVVALKELEEEQLDHEKLYKLTLRRLKVFSGSSFSDIPSSTVVKAEDKSIFADNLDPDMDEVKDKRPARGDNDISFADDEEE